MTDCVLGLPGQHGYSRGRLHVVEWTKHFGPVPSGMVVGHVCHDLDLSCSGGVTCLHRRCYNIHHLRAMTQQENLRSGRTYDEAVNERRSVAVHAHHSQPHVLKKAKEQGIVGAHYGWSIEDRSSKFCSSCGCGPFRGNRALTLHEVQRGCPDTRDRRREAK